MLKLKISVIFWVFLVVVGGLLPSDILAGISVLDDFETYEVGNLTPQSDWYFTAGNQDFSVNTTKKFSGEKSIKPIGADSWVFNDTFFSNSTTGSISVEVFVEYNATYKCMPWQVQANPDNAHFGFLIKSLDVGGICKIMYASSSNWIVLSEMIYDEFFKLDIEWKFESAKLYGRYNINDIGWTNWVLPYGDYLQVSTIGLKAYYGAIYPLVYFDYLTTGFERCELTGCKYCQTYDTCLGAGCMWYYSVFLQQHFCVEPYYPEEEECGSFYKCQFCNSTTTCEAELNCEWKDIGFGEKCYMIEPTIPPEQVGWEVPELEDCEELSGVEKWLCEIKNFIAGIFLPSQAKVDNLYNTIATIKEKFPFNYLGVFSIFFDNVKAGLEEPEKISFKIFGKQGDVSFSFWQSTTTIGAVSQNFGDIVKTFTTIVVLIFWFVWVISFLKRVF